MHFKMLSAVSSNLVQSKILSSGNGFRNQILSRNSKEDHGMNISVKLNGNWISSFREDDV